MKRPCKTEVFVPLFSKSGPPEAIVFQKLKESRKYKYLCDDTLRRISGWAVERYDGKQAVKAAKNKLHQVYGSYFENVNIKKIQTIVEEGGDVEKILCQHASTCERLPFIEEFYRDLFGRIGMPGRVLDLACGLNPFSVPLMGLGEGVEYIAYDIDTRLIAVINTFFSKMKKSYRAECGDILVSVPAIEADVVFLLKALPCLEQQEKGVSEKIIGALKAKYIVISFPSKSLTGKEKGMGDYYHRFILEILERSSLEFFKLNYSNEIFYVAIN